MKLIVKPMDHLITGYVACIDPADALVLGVKENDRIRVTGPKGEMAVVVVVADRAVNPGELLVSIPLMKRVGASEGCEVCVAYSPNPDSVRSIRRKMDGQKLDSIEIVNIVNDIYQGNLSTIETSAWLTALYINGMDLDEIAVFANALVDTGDRVEFGRSPVFDFHSMGGVPGNKITPIVVSICAAAGLMVPKTSSRAISSACGTSDFVELFCPVEVTLDRLREIGETVGGAFVWGGSMNIAPVDDMVIKIEHPLGINPRAQMLASILGKKLAIGADFLLIDIPTGGGTKVPTIEAAKEYSRDFMALGEKLGIHIECAITYADQPVGHAIGPALEARECLRVLEGDDHPASVIEKACECAGMLLEMGGIPDGARRAREILRTGEARKKFLEIVVAQGGSADIKSSDMPVGKHTVDIISKRSGYVNRVVNSDLVAVAKALGAPSDKGAGIEVIKKRGHRVEVGDVLFRLYADNDAKLARAKDMAEKLMPVVIEGMILSRVTE
ncbi:MAG: AMP phosphorylase [Thermoplasmata archaeon]|nr:AMP phosphorylase [Thermoplasmata archaeon]